MKKTVAGEFAGKQISVTLSATNPGSWSVSTSSQEDQSLLVEYDGLVTYNGKELRLEITQNSVKVEVVRENAREKNTLTVVTPKGATKTVDILPDTKPTLDFGPMPNILIDDFPFDIEHPVMLPKKKKTVAEIKHNTLDPSYGIVYLTAKSATEIHTLNTRRIADSGYISHSELSGVQVDYFKQNEGVFFDVMMSNNAVQRLKDAVHTAVTKCGCRTLFFLIDEAHVGAGENHQISTVLLQFDYRSENGGTITVDGIDVALKIVATTATPTKKISQVIGTRSALHVRAEPAEGYFGVEHLLSSDRMIDAEKNIPAKELADLLKSHPGYRAEGIIVLRPPTNKRNSRYVEDLRVALGGKHIVQTFDAKNRNLEFFAEFVSSGREARGRGAIAVLKDGFSAGFTLDQTEHISAWVDLHYNDFEAQCQSVGRIFGYGKLDDRFPIVTVRNGLERYEESIQQFRENKIPSVNVGFTSEKRAASKLKFMCRGEPKYVIGTEKDFRADFDKRSYVWPSKLVKDNRNSDSLNHIVKQTEDLAHQLLHPGKTLYLRGFDLSIPGKDLGREIKKEDCPKWFKPDGLPKDGVEAVKLFNHFRKLRTLHKDDLAAGRNIIWLSSENEIISKFEANDDVRGKLGNSGLKPPDARFKDLKVAKDEDGVPNTFFDVEVGEVPESMIELVKHVQGEINRWYVETAKKGKKPEKIYDSAVLPAAQLLYSAYARPETAIILTSQMQAGKTGIMILFMHCVPYLNEYTLQNG